MVKEQLRTAINDPEALEQQANEQLDGEYKEEAKKLEERYKAELEKHPRFKGTKARTQARYAATVATQLAKRAGIAPSELMNFAPTLVFTDADQTQQTAQNGQGIREDGQAEGAYEQNQTGSQQNLLVREGIVRKPDSATATVVEIPENQVPQFKTVKELKEWIISQFSSVRSAVIKSTNQTVKVANKGLKDSLKRKREEKHNDIYPVLLSVLENAEYDHFQLNDGQEKHKGTDGQDVYFSAIRIGGKLYSVRFKVDIPSKLEIESRKKLGMSDIEDVRYKDHTLNETDLSEVSVHPGFNPADTRQVSVADSATGVSLGVLRGQVKPSRIEEGTLYQKQATPTDPLVTIHNPTASIDTVRAKYQGTDQWLKAPNGEDTQLTEAQWCLVRTPEFKAWFGDWENDPANASKVVDKNGEPLVVYHGGQGRVEDFSRGTVRGHMGQAYFTDSIGAGASYAFLGGIDGTVETPDDAGYQWTHRSDKNIQAHPHITKAFLNIRHPITPNKIRLKDVVNMFGKELADLEEDNVAFAKFDGDFDAAAEWLSDPSNLQEWLEESLTDEVASNTIENDFLSMVDEDGELQASQGFIALHLLGEIPQYMAAKGYDGFAYADNEAGGTTYVVQAPTQIKSASFNNGEFNPNDSNIYRQDAAEPLTDPLVTIHNIRETGLLNVDKLGALPVPSLAVTKAGNEYNQYGEISLIGTKGMVDPGRTPVFSAGAYTDRFYKRNRPVKSIRSPRVESGGHSTGLSGR